MKIMINKIMIIPIGVDCGIADWCKKNNLRSFSFPFDWNVSYNGVSAVIQDDFNEYIPDNNNRINKYDIYFHHDFFHHTFEQDKIKYLRRIDRLQNILKTSTEQIIFIRKGHACHHHNEHDNRYNIIKSDITDAEDLNKILLIKYPQLNYKIIVLLVCGTCFDPNINYTSNSDNIFIYNIAMKQLNDNIIVNCLHSAVNETHNL